MTDKPAWLDLSSGVSGEMLLGALVDAGVPLSVLRSAVAALGLPVSLQHNSTRRGGLSASWVLVQVTDVQPARRPWAEVRDLLAAAPLDDDVRESATAVFTALAEAEATVLQVPADAVVLHEVGSHSAVAEVVGTCAGLHWLRREERLDSLSSTPVALGGGTVTTVLGELPVPAPSVLSLLQRSEAPSVGGPVDGELATRVGVALVSTLVDSWGPMPETHVGVVGMGADQLELGDRPHVVRLVMSQ